MNVKSKMKIITDISELKTGKKYLIEITQFNKVITAVCLGNYNCVKEMKTNKVYFSDVNSFTVETPQSMRRKFKNNIMPACFVCWDFMIGKQYVIMEC